MKTISSLAKKERKEIFSLFSENSKLKFNQIEKSVKIRSNMVSYHLDQMRKEGLIQKEGDFYSLTTEAEKYIPILTNIIEDKHSPLPVILVALINNNKILLIKRNKRPYQNYWSMIGGKIKLEESFEEAAKRHILEKTGIDAEFEKFCSIFHEHVKKDDSIQHSFILNFVKMKTDEEKFKLSPHGKLKWFSLDQLNEDEIIPSDYWLIQNKLNSKIEIQTGKMEEKKEKLINFLSH